MRSPHGLISMLLSRICPCYPVPLVDNYFSLNHFIYWCNHAALFIGVLQLSEEIFFKVSSTFLQKRSTGEMMSC